MRKILLSILVLTLAIATTDARPSRGERKFEYRLKAGFNLGGTSPLPLPREIRKVNGYSPTLSLNIGADVVRHINSKWAIMSGIKFETKGMTTRATVKNYYIDMNISEGEGQGNVKGMFTGKVKTKAKNEYLTVPITGIYKISDRWELNLGFYFSYLLNGNFSGSANDGYIREDSPVGTKLGVTAATYDFAQEIRKFNWGVQTGARYRAYRQFSVYGDLSVAANSIFKKEFTGISFDMYNIYLDLGFAYTF